MALNWLWTYWSCKAMRIALQRANSGICIGKEIYVKQQMGVDERSDKFISCMSSTLQEDGQEVLQYDIRHLL